MTSTTNGKGHGYRAVSVALFTCLFAAQAALIAMSPVLAQAARDLRRLDGCGRTAAHGHRPRRRHHRAPARRVGGRIGLGRQLLGGAALLALGSLASAAAPNFALLAAGAGAGRRRRRMR